MTYPKVDFTSARTALEAQMKPAKRRADFDPRVWDGRILAKATELTNAAMAIVDDYHAKVDHHHGVAKKAMNQMEAEVKKGKKLSPADIKFIDTLAQTVTKQQEKVEKYNQPMFDALKEFRGMEFEKWPKLFTDQRLFKPLSAKREKSIDEGKQKDALRKRLAEYVARSEDLTKLARQQITRGGALAHDEAGEIARFQAQVQKLRTEFEDLVYKTKTPMGFALDLDPKKKLDAGSLKMAEGRILNLAAQTKGVRGALKTFDMKVQAFKKMASKFLDQDKKQAQAAYTAAAKLLATSQAEAKTLAENEAKAIKLLETVKKLP